jgi:serpin B
MLIHSAKKISVSVLLVLALLAGSCSSAKDTDNTKNSSALRNESVSYKATLTAQTISAFPAAFVTGMNKYGLQVASALYDGKNLAVSPASLELAILMARTGAIGATSEEMKKALSMSDLSDDEILSACQQLMWRTNTNGMEAANSLWMQKDYSFAGDFVNTCTNKFMADAFAVNFMTDAKGATDAINTWASDKTHGKIAKMNSSPLPADTRLVLINALYFLGDWENPFKAENSYSQTFHGTSNDSDVSFMHNTQTMLYAETTAYQMISMPFKGADGDADSPYSMAFILPKEGTDITAVMDDLAAKSFSSSVAGLSDAKVNLALPKFEFTYDTDMIDTMKSLGMNLAFDSNNAQFDKMTGGKNNLFISDILHKCYIRVDEKGAEAAAVTEVVAGMTAMPVQEDLKTFTADRPFLFAIYDETDDSVLFLGAVGQL